MLTWKNVHSDAVVLIVLKISIWTIWAKVLFKTSVSLLISIWKIYLLMSMDVKVLYYDCICIDLSFFMNQGLHYKFYCIYFVLMNVFSDYTFLLDWSFYHYVICLLSLTIKFVFKTFVYFKYSYHNFLLFLFAWRISFHPFRMCVSSELKCDSCRQHVHWSCFFLFIQLPMSFLLLFN